MEEEIYQALDAGVTFSVAWGPLENADLPRASLMRMSGVRDQSIDGPSDLIVGRIQVDVFAVTYLEARDAGNQVRDLLEAHAGPVVEYIALDAIRDGFDTDVSVVHRVSLTFSITYRE